MRKKKKWKRKKFAILKKYENGNIKKRFLFLSHPVTTFADYMVSVTHPGFWGKSILFKNGVKHVTTVNFTP